MADILKSIRSNDPNPDHAEQREEMLDWNRETAEFLASRFDITLSPEHWRVIEYLRRMYLDDGLPPEARLLAADLDATFLDQGGMRYLYKLFPDGPVLQGCTIAGIPVPEHSLEKASGIHF